LFEETVSRGNREALGLEDDSVWVADGIENHGHADALGEIEREPMDGEWVDFEFDSAGVPTTDSLQLFLNEAGRYPLLTAAEEVELPKRIERGDVAAKERMIASNLRLVVSIARRYQTQGVTLGDLIQDGVFGLIRATEKFDWRKGFKFSTYASWWIRQAVQRGAANKARTIRIPIHVVERERKIARTQRELTARHGHPPSDEEIAIHANLSLAQLLEIRGAARAVLSIDAPLGADSAASLGDVLAVRNRSVEDEVEATIRAERVRRAVADLPSRQRQVITLRFGLAGDGPSSFEQIGKRLGISRERVRQIETAALERLAVHKALRDDPSGGPVADAA
jgi:RNA polymerase primary sigma factor